MILFEDEYLLAINKPAGLVVHADGRTAESTLVDWVKEHYPNLESIGGLHTLDSERYVPRWGIVHRLDRETSGVILIAKEAQTFLDLQRQFVERKTVKTYHAITWGRFSEKAGIIDDPIGRSRSDFRQWTVGADARGTLRPAITEYRVLAEHDDCTFVELTPKTGRTHQLRVHLKSLGHPIIADNRYAPEKGSALGFTRLALHAQKILFQYSTMEYITTKGLECIITQILLIKRSTYILISSHMIVSDYFQFLISRI